VPETGSNAAIYIWPTLENTNTEVSVNISRYLFISPEVVG
jgi:hypothetical protein